MALKPRTIGPLVLRLLTVLALLGGPQLCADAGTWSVISLPPQPGDVRSLTALAVDAAGSLYVADLGDGHGRIQKRDAQGSWFTLATFGDAPGQVYDPSALAVDAAGNLYVADESPGALVHPNLNYGRIQKRDSLGNWSTLAASSGSPYQVRFPRALAVDLAGNLYVADYGGNNLTGRIGKRDAQGHWSVLAISGTGLGRINYPNSLTVDAAGNLYVADNTSANDGRIQKRDAQGHWSVVATAGTSVGEVGYSGALAADATGNLYVAGWIDKPDAGGPPLVIFRIQKRDVQGNWSVLATSGTTIGTLAVGAEGSLYVADAWRIQKRDAQGIWSLLATAGTALGQVTDPIALAADAAGNLYVADADYDPATGMYPSRIQKRDPRGNWSVIATNGSDPGQVNDEVALAADGAGNLYVAEIDANRLQKRDAQGHWSVLSPERPSSPLGVDRRLVNSPSAMAVDAAGNLYVVDLPMDSTIRIQKRDTQGNWSVLATRGPDSGQLLNEIALAVDAAGNLYVSYGSYVADGNFINFRIRMRDARGNWSVVPTGGGAPGQVDIPTGLAVDTAGNLYVAESGNGARIQKRDVQGNWSVLATSGYAPGQVLRPSGLAVDTAGHLYVADTGNDRVQLYTPNPSQ